MCADLIYIPVCGEYLRNTWSVTVRAVSRGILCFTPPCYATSFSHIRTARCSVYRCRSCVGAVELFDECWSSSLVSGCALS